MTADIVERLKASEIYGADYWTVDPDKAEALITEAAAEITRLTSLVEELEGLLTTTGICQEKLRKDRDRAREEAERIASILADPAKVHLNMVRGSIAKPSLRDMLHAYGFLADFDGLVHALKGYGFPVSDTAESALAESGSQQGQALNAAAKKVAALITASPKLTITPSLDPSTDEVTAIGEGK